MHQNEIACPKCGSKEYKKRFFAGSDTTGVVCALLALIFMGTAGVFELLLDGFEGRVQGWADIMQRVAAHKIVGDQLVLVVLFVLLSVMGFTSKRYRCGKCRTTFS